MKKNLLWALSMMAITSFMLSSCGDDADPIAPMVTIDNTTFTGDIGDEVTAVINGELDGDFASLQISKFIGTTADATYGTNGVLEITTGLPFTFSATLGTEGILEPVRYNFLVTDDNDLTASVDLIITTEASISQLLVSFDWRYSSLLSGDPPTEEGIAECELDNIYSYESDGTMSLDFGVSEPVAGSCAADGQLEWVTWSFDANEEVLTAVRVDVLPDGTTVPKDEVVWTIISFDQTAWSASEASIFGELIYTFTAQAKN